MLNKTLLNALGALSHLIFIKIYKVSITITILASQRKKSNFPGVREGRCQSSWVTCIRPYVIITQCKESRLKNEWLLISSPACLTSTLLHHFTRGVATWWTQVKFTKVGVSRCLLWNHLCSVSQLRGPWASCSSFPGFLVFIYVLTDSAESCIL